MPLLWNAKVDANQGEIVQALRDAYCSVLPLHRLGQGSPDLAVGYQGRTYFLEVKNYPYKLTPAEVEFMNTWRGHYVIVGTVDEALKAIGVIE